MNASQTAENLKKSAALRKALRIGGAVAATIIYAMLVATCQDRMLQTQNKTTDKIIADFVKMRDEGSREYIEFLKYHNLINQK
jgi:hypothetical protein